MAIVSPKALKEFKEIFKKKYGYELNDKDAYESAQNLLNFFELLYNIAQEEHLREQRLKKEPKEFCLEAGKYYTCGICEENVLGEKAWWDKYGTKCMNCQRNIDKNVIPEKLLRDKFPTDKSDNWYISWQLKDKFGIHSATVRKLVREGKLKSIQLKNEEGRIYHEIFPKKENEEYLSTFKPKM